MKQRISLRLHTRIILVILCQVLTFTAYSQVTVKGTITSSEDEPLIGATVMLKNTTTGTISDVDGSFFLTVPTVMDTLVFTYTGFSNEEVPLAGRTKVDVTLSAVSTLMDEVVVVGYGTSQRGNVSGSISNVGSERLETRPVTRVEQALSGQMAGVRVRTTSGDLGAPLQVIIRGSSSVSASNEPLYVVDGFPTTDISDLVVGDIASIDVLKDASSAAIYGSRGANGVVLITTKSGQKGKTKFSFSTYRGLQTVEKKLDMMNSEQWIETANELIDRNWVARGRDIGQDYRATDSYEFRFAELNGHNNRYMPDTRWEDGTDSLVFIDWQDEMFRTAPIQEHRLSASGGNENIKFHITGTYFNQEGIILNTDFTRVNFRANLSMKFSDKLSMDMNISPTLSIANGGRATGKDAMVHYALSMVPVANLGVGIETGVFPNPTYQYAGSPVSPVAYMREITYRQDDFRARTNIGLNYKISKDLTAKLTGAFDNRALKLHRYLPTNVARRNTNEPEGALSSGILDNRGDTKFLVQGTLNYTKKFGRHSISTLGGYSVENRQWNRSFQKHANFGNDRLTTFFETTSTVQNSFFNKYDDRLLSYFGRAQYNYADRYLISASVRRDGSSRFGKNNFWGNFPSLSVAWRASNEPFMADIEAISSLKFRYSIGETGNNSIPLYRSYAELSSSNYSFNNQVSFGLATSTLENQDLAWEKTVSSNYGVDLGLFQNRFLLSVDYYVKNTRDMLYYVPVATVTGFTNGWRNIGELQNKGFEIDINTRNLTGKFKWETSLNFSRNRNTVVSLGPDDTPILAGFQARTQILEVGRPVFTYYMHDAIGVYMNQEDVENSPSMPNTQPGDIKYRDVNGDGVIDILDKDYVGNPEPDFFWGFTNTFKYKNFDLSVLVQGQIGGSIYGIIGRAIDIPGSYLHNRPAFWDQRWRSEDNPGNGSVPRIDYNTGGLYDSRWLYDATYWKIKNVTLTYNIPSTAIKGINGGQIYFSGDNLFMRDRYLIGFSPEAQNNEGGDYGGYPLYRVLTLGLKASF
ncbi:MAG: SusC/RagA family TonB-linked outer membrane protein [Lewinella sp.]